MGRDKPDKKRRVSSSSSSSSDSDSDREKERLRALKKKLKKEQKKTEKYLKKKLKEQRKKLKKRKRTKSRSKSVETRAAPVCTVDNDEAAADIPIELMDKSKSMAPMTKEEWDKRQSVIRKVLDEDTGRYRLIKGDGEVLEEIVTRVQHKQINRQATMADGNFFQTQTKTNRIG